MTGENHICRHKHGLMVLLENIFVSMKSNDFSLAESSLIIVWVWVYQHCLEVIPGISFILSGAILRKFLGSSLKNCLKKFGILYWFTQTIGEIFLYQTAWLRSDFCKFAVKNLDEKLTYIWRKPGLSCKKSSKGH